MICPRYVLVFLTVLAWLTPSLAQKQEPAEKDVLSQLPSCGSTCLDGIISEYPCSSINVTCLCSDTRALNKLYTCVTRQCSQRAAFLSMNITTTSCRMPKRHRTTSITYTSTILGSFTLAFVIIRLTHRIFIAKSRPFLDDWLVCLCVLVGAPSTIITIKKLGPSGLGKDAWTIPYDRIQDFAYWFFITEVFYFALLALMKLVLLAFYLRLFSYRTIRIWLWITVAFVIMFGLSFVLASVFQCRPVDYTWKHWDDIDSDECVDIDALVWCNAGINIGLDIWMLAMPLSQLPALKLPWKRKAGVGLMFSVGTFVTIMSFFRLGWLHRFNSSVNLTWDSSNVVLWSVIEVNVGIMCTCMPALRLVLVWLIPSLGDKESPGRTTRRRSWRMRVRVRSWVGGQLADQPRPPSLRLWPGLNGGLKPETTTSINGPPGDEEQGLGAPDGQQELRLEMDGITFRQSFGVMYDGIANASQASTTAGTKGAEVPDDPDGGHIEGHD